MATYQKFLKNSAKFFGITMVDLGLTMAFLLCLNLVHIPSIIALVIAVLVLVSKVFFKKLFDLRHLYILFPRMKTVSWYEWMRRY